MNQKPEDNNTIESYVIEKVIGKGGMGEVFLAYDPKCKRKIALKKIRKELSHNSIIRERFLLEAKIAASLVHPSIIPIFSIHAEEDSLYYTMPYVEGKTLKNILQEARQHYIKGETIPPEASIPNLMRVFHQICEAVAYIHTKKILHRDLKPDNIIIGKYGEALILDWGIANYLNAPSNDKDPQLQENENTNFTRPGKIAGTLTHLAPERASGAVSSIQTDLYSLGVMLYQILALTPPFPRANIEEFKKFVKHEKFTDPTLVVPFRDIPQELVEIAKKCLEADPSKRFLHVEELLKDLNNFSEGKPKWLFSKDLHIDNNEDWAFDANLLPSKNVAISGLTDLPEWVHAMISADSFSDNLCIQTTINLKKESHGIGFLIAMPEHFEGSVLEEGYCIWLASKETGTSRLYRKGVHVMNIPSINLEANKKIHVVIEKLDTSLSLFIDGKLLLNYRSHTPISGRCMGVVHKDTDFQLSPLQIYTTSYNAQISCLALPDAFLAKKDYFAALAEYRHIGHSFAGRTEGREALFRAGLTLLEKGKHQKSLKKKKEIFQETLKEFEHLRNTAGAPLEYLGKSLVYAALNNPEEEAKCLELACRKYPKHPLLPILHEHVLYRVHESSLNNREGAYRLILFALRYVPYFLENAESIELLESLQKHWENIPFFIPAAPENLKNELNIQLCFRLGRAPLIIEMIENNKLDSISLENAFFALLNLGHIRSCEKLLKNELAKAAEQKKNLHPLHLIQTALLCHTKSPKEATEKLLSISSGDFSEQELRVAFYIIQQALDTNELSSLPQLFEKVEKSSLTPVNKELLDQYKVWSLLLKKDFITAATIFQSYPIETLEDEQNNFHFLYGCYLFFQEGQDKAKVHFDGVLDTLYPYSPVFLSYYLKDKNKDFQKHAFFFEKKQLYRQLALFYDCKEDLDSSSKNKKYLNKKSL